MKFNKILGIALSTAMVSSVLAVPAMADDESGYWINQDFSNAFWSNGNFKQGETAAQDLYPNGSNVDQRVIGLGGRAKDDNSFQFNAAADLDITYGKRSDYAAKATGGIITGEASYYTASTSGSGQISLLSNSGWSANLAGVKFDNGSIKYKTKAGDVDTGLKYNANQWYKIALEADTVNNKTKLYINGKFIMDIQEAPNAIARFQVAHSNGTTTLGAVDDYKLYAGSYDATDDVITLPSGVTVSNGNISIAEGTTLEQLKTMVGDAAIYADNTYLAAATEINDNTVVIFTSKSGETFEYYGVKAVSKYDGAYLDYSFDDVKEAESFLADTTTNPASIVTSAGGRTDNIAYVKGGNKNEGLGGWNTVYDTKVMTVECMVYNPNKAQIQLYPTNGSGPNVLATAQNRLGINLTGGGKVQYMHNSWTPNDTNKTYNPSKWTKVAYTLNSDAQTMKIYVDGALVYTYENVGMTDTGFAKDIRISVNNAYAYLDNLRIYPTEYKGDAAVNAPTSLTYKAGTKASDVESAVAVLDKNGNSVDTISEGCVAVFNNGELYENVAINVTIPTETTLTALAGSVSEEYDVNGQNVIDAGFVTGEVSLNDAAKFGTVVANFGADVVKSYPFKTAFPNVPTVSGDGNIEFGITITEIPAMYKDTVSVSFTE